MLMMMMVVMMVMMMTMLIMIEMANFQFRFGLPNPYLSPGLAQVQIDMRISYHRYDCYNHHYDQHLVIIKIIIILKASKLGKREDL